MPLQTSKIYSDGNDNLKFKPNASLKIVSSLDVQNAGETPLSTQTTTGKVKRLDIDALNELTAVDPADWLLYQDASDGKKLKKISAAAFKATQPPFSPNLPVNGVWIDINSVLAVKAGGNGSTAALKNSVEFAIINQTFNQADKNVAAQNRVQVRWMDSKLRTAAHNQKVSGVLYAKSGTTFTQTWDLTVKKQPTTGWAFTNVIDQPISTTIPSDVAFPDGFNAPSPVTIDGGSMANIQVSIHGAAFTAAPDVIYPGQSIIVRGDTGASLGTDYTAKVSIGGVQRTFKATTATARSVAQASIIAPVVNSTDLGDDIVILGSAYTPVEGAGTHASSDWELKKAGVVVLSSTGDTTNLTSWPIPAVSLDENTEYTVRVRYTSSDPETSAWSAEIAFTTGTF